MVKHIPLAVLLTSYALLLLLFPLRMQAIESYQYAAGAEGFYNLTTTFQTAQPHTKLPDFSRFHPNHPFLHALAGFLHKVTQIPALVIFKAINFAASLVSLALFYFICLALWGNTHTKVRRKAGRVAALAATCLMAGSHAFYMAALSGEVHLVSLAFFLAAVYCLLRSFSEPEARRSKFLLWAALWVACSLAFHLIVIFVLPLGLSALRDMRGKRPWRIHLLAALIVTLAFGIVYGGLLVYVLAIDSFQQYTGTLFVYKFLIHVRYSGFEWYWIFMKSWAHVLVYGFFTGTVALQLQVAALYARGFFVLFKTKIPAAAKLLLVLWPVSYLGMHLLLGSRADSVNYWHFALPGVFAVIGFTFLHFYQSGFMRFLVYVIPVAVFAVNFFSAVYPNARLPLKDILFVDHPREMLLAAGVNREIKPDHKVGILTKDPVLTFPEIYNLGSRLGFRNQDFFIFCCGKKGYEENLQKWFAAHDTFFFIVDEEGDEIPKMLAAAGKKFLIIREASGEIQENWLTTSIYFKRPEGYRIRKYIRVFFVDPFLK